jgi:hypothetical protein
MATRYPLLADHQQTNDTNPIIKSIINCSEQIADEYDSSKTLDHHTHSPSNSDNMQIDDNYMYFKKKFNKIKLQIPTDLKDAKVLWSIDTTSPPHIGYLAYLLIMNMLNKSNKTFLIISDVHGYFNNLNSELSEHEIKMKSYYAILSHFNIGTIIKTDDIYYTKDYQKSLFQLTRSVKIIEAIQSARRTMQKSVEIEMLRASDLMSILLILNNILYFNITYVLIEEHETSLYKFISSLLSNEYGKTLNILEIPIFPDLHETDMYSSSVETSKILLDVTKDQIYEQFSKLKHTRKSVIHNYLKAMIDVLYNEETSFHDKFPSGMDITDIIDDIRRNILLSSSVNSDPPIYVAASFLTDQFHVLKKHWKKNINKDDKFTGTGKGIDGLQANHKGFEPQLGGKFVIINWSNKEIVYMLDIDAPAGFFIEDNYLYIANNRLHYISIIDLIRQIEIKRIDNLAFNCLHSIHRAENETLLVTSTGIDAIIQINSNGDRLNDWYATEHEYSVTPKGEKRNIERDFDHHHYIYPTLHQTTHINSAIILDSDHYLATLFHQGLLVKINRTSGKSKVLLSGLNCPHAIKRYRSMKQNEIVWMLCNTKQNELVFLNDDFKIIQKMILEDVNWLQDATQIQNEHIIIADANNSRIIEIDPDLNTVISEFVYSNDWRIYQISDLTDFQTNFIPTKHINK